MPKVYVCVIYIFLLLAIRLTLERRDGLRMMAAVQYLTGRCCGRAGGDVKSKKLQYARRIVQVIRGARRLLILAQPR